MAALTPIGTESIQLAVNFNEVIGMGRFCDVHPGIYEGREVAVKKVRDPDRSRLRQEIEALKDFDDTHIVRYKVFVEDRDFGYFGYVVLEKCFCSLADVIYRRQSIGDSLDEVSIFKQASLGLYYLHWKAEIIHRNIHPSNILVSKKNNEFRIRLSDFGLVKPSSTDASVSCSATSGDLRYSSPEERKGDRISHNTDIFSLGLCFVAVLSDGKNPYGDDDIDIDHKIRTGGDPDLSCIRHLHDGYAFPLIKSMLMFWKEDRPGIEVVLAHYLFWDQDKTLLFLHSVSDDLAENKKFRLHDNMNAVSNKAIGNPYWYDTLIDGLSDLEIQHIKEDFKKHPPFNGVCGVLRLIRNWFNHYEDKSPVLKKMLGSGKAGISTFFRKKFPMLLPKTYEVYGQKHQEEEFHKYYLHQEE